VKTIFQPIRQYLLATLVALSAGSACVGDELSTGQLQSAATVESFETTACSTSTVLGLSQQIAEEVACLLPSQLEPFEETSQIVFTGSAVLPYLDPAGIAELREASKSVRIEINSAFRTVAQQYLLRAWKERGRCGITAAAIPGKSNHESGRALDIENYEEVGPAMRRNGWEDDEPGDPVHFDHLASPDIRGADVQAFQRLWNRNHPEDLISEDGSYGAQTEIRLQSSPGGGFAKGADCGTPKPPTTPPDNPQNDRSDGEGDSGTCNTSGKNSGIMIVAMLMFICVRRRRMQA
jgi:hypothetical protein